LRDCIAGAAGTGGGALMQTEAIDQKGPAPAQAKRAALTISVSRHFEAWLAERLASLAFTTYQAGKLFFVGLKPDGRLSVFERSFERCMGLAATPQTLWLSSLYQLWRLENVVEPGALHEGFDRLYVPQASYVTGDVDVHDIAVDADGQPIFVNTLFSCLARPSATHSFQPLWQPPFLSRLAAEDRCHLNGLAMRDGRAAYVTMVARSDVADGWREQREAGGVVMEVASGEVVAAGLSMPHSPRWHAETLWLLNSGTGEFGRIDPARGRFEPVAFCPGYARGLCFVDGFAVIGLSRPRAESRTFQGLPLDERLAARGAAARCGILVVDLKSGDAVHWARIEGAVSELYDIAALPGVRRPMALGFKTDEIRRMVRIGPPAER
jgi:uncharacterized protein (TIGR03032 family)